MPVELKVNSGVQAFGMSITTGALANNAPNYWVNRFAQFIGGPVENRAISGTGLPSMVAQSNSYSPYGDRTKIGLIDGPLNDVRQAAAACLGSVKPAYDAMISNMFSGYYRGAAWPAPAVTRTGSWSPLSGFGGRSTFFAPNTPIQTTDPAASVAIQFTGPVVCVHGFASETDDWLDWDIEIDGAYWGATDWAFKARPGAGKQPVAMAIDVGAGSHTIKLSPPVGGIPSGHRLVLDGIQCPLMAPPVLLGSVPDIANWAGYGAIGTWADAQSCNAIIEQVGWMPSVS